MDIIINDIRDSSKDVLAISSNFVKLDASKLENSNYNVSILNGNESITGFECEFNDFAILESHFKEAFENKKLLEIYIELVKDKGMFYKSSNLKDLK